MRIRQILLPLVLGAFCAQAQTAVHATPSQRVRRPEQVRQQHEKAVALRLEQMRSEMEAGDARLEQLAKTMNATTGLGRLDAMQAVINELVAQRLRLSELLGEAASAVQDTRLPTASR